VHGGILAGLLGAPSPADAPPEPFAQWYHLALASAVYLQPAPLLRLQSVGDFVLAAMRACGAPVADALRPLPSSSASCRPPRSSSCATATRPRRSRRAARGPASRSPGLQHTLAGNAAAAVRTMIDVPGQPWAAAHLCDLLWQGGVSGRGAAGPLMPVTGLCPPPPPAAPARATRVAGLGRPRFWRRPPP